MRETMAMTDQNNQDSIENAEEIIERFGGIRPMANKMDVPVTTVQGWKKRNVIPGNRRDEVMEAARSNNIDLSDIIAGVANENKAVPAAQKTESAEAKPFEREMETASREESEQTKARHDQAVLQAQNTEESAHASNVAMMEEMRRAQSMVFTKNAWFSGALVAIAVVVCAVLLWPNKHQIEKNSQDIAQLQGEVVSVKEKHSFLGALIPEDLEQRFGDLQNQAKAVEGRVTELGTRVETIAKDMTDKSVPVSARLQKLEQHAVSLGAPYALTNMLQKVQQMQNSLEGQASMTVAISELNAMFTTQDDEGNLQQALMEAQQQDDELGQALQGVAPQDLKAAAMLLGLSQMRSSFNRDKTPFTEDLALMQNMVAKDDPALQASIAKLAPKAESGVLTPDGLKSEFKGLAGDIVVASLKGEDVSLQEKAKARFNDLLSVEKDGELVTGTDTQAKVARAQKMLDEGNIEDAIAELQSLEGPAAQAAQPFIDEAQMTVLSQNLQGMFTGKVLNKIGGMGDMNMGGENVFPNMARPGLPQLLGEVKKLAPPRHVIKDEASGFVILAPKQTVSP